MTDIRIDLFQDLQHPVQQFHLVAFTAGVQRRGVPTMCGRTNFNGMRRSAFFPLGDPRGNHHVTNCCDVCLTELEQLVVAHADH